AADRRAEEPVGGGEDVDGGAEAREGPGETLTIDAAHGDQAVDGAAGGGGIVERLAGRRALAGELVGVAVAGRGDEEEALAVRIGLEVRVDAADHQLHLL